MDSIGIVLSPMLKGAAVTVGLTIVSGGLGLALSFAVGLFRDTRLLGLRWVLAAYVQIFRGTSGLVQLYIVFYVLPTFGLFLPAVIAGIVVLSLNTGAYGSEIVRAGIASVDPGQRDAAVALNMTARTTMRQVILPQAVVQMIPPFSNLMVELLKGTSLVSLIAITELAFAGRQVISAGGQATPIYAIVLVLYYVLAKPITIGATSLERRLAKRMSLGRPQ